GIVVEADAAVTGNVIENAPDTGISIGWGRYLRDVSVVGNIIRRARRGIVVSVTRGAGTALVTGNLIAEAADGAIVGMDHTSVIEADLAGASARYSGLEIGGNRVR